MPAKRTPPPPAGEHGAPAHGAEHVPPSGGATPSTDPVKPGGDPGHFSIGGKRVSYDALFIGAGGLLAAWFVLRGQRSGSSGAVVSGTALPQSPAAPGGGGMPGLLLPIIDSGPGSAPATATPGLISALYGSVLDRSSTADAPGTAFWTTYEQTSGPAATASAFLATPEAQVQGAYETELGRYADPAGLTYWVGQVQGGMTVPQLDAAIMASPEYVAAHKAA
jgi:hypothetical protein